MCWRQQLLLMAMPRPLLGWTLRGQPHED